MRLHTSTKSVRHQRQKLCHHSMRCDATYIQATVLIQHRLQKHLLTTTPSLTQVGCRCEMVGDGLLSQEAPAKKSHRDRPVEVELASSQASFRTRETRVAKSGVLVSPRGEVRRPVTAGFQRGSCLLVIQLDSHVLHPHRNHYNDIRVPEYGSRVMRIALRCQLYLDMSATSKEMEFLHSK